MKSLKLYPMAVALAGLLAVGGCSNNSKAPDVSGQIRQQLDQAGLKDVSVSQDRDKGVVTLKGSVPNDQDKSQAESIARSVASSQVVANEIGVRPPNEESTAKSVDSKLDAGIEKNVDAMLIKHKLNHAVSVDVKNGVVTLTGKVRTEQQRAQAEKLVAGVPNVKQVVNEIEIKGAKATSGGGR
jgi:hyperosmotically inducible periplasmic protein